MSDKEFVGPPVDTISERHEAGEVSRRGLLLRPLGYFGIAIVWFVLTVVVLALLAAIPYAILQQGDLASSPGVAKFKDPGEVVAALIALPIVAVMFGAVICLLLVGSFSLFILSLIAFSRSLRPSFAKERLTTTRWTSEAIGPVRAGNLLSAAAGSGGPLSAYREVLDKQSLSLIPVRRTKFSGAVTALMFFAFVPSGAIVLASTILGLAYLVTVAWVTWPVTGPTAVVWAVVSTALTVVGVWRVHRAYLRNVAKQFAQPTV
ncbi:MAG: hypothetical protein ABJA94_06560 [Rhodoglobus sp.]